MPSATRRHWAAPLAVTVLATGCFPSASVRAPKVDDVSWQEVQAHIDVHAENPWPIDITVTAVEGTITVGDVEVLSHRHDTPVTVEARGEAKVRFPFAVETKRLYEAAEGLLDAGATPYLLDGVVTLATPVGEVEVPVSSSGTLPALAKPTVKLPDIKVKDISLTEGTADLVFLFDVDNPNDIALELKKVRYGARITGSDVISGSTPSIELAASSESKLRLPVHLDAGAVGRGLLKAFQKGRLKGEAFVTGRAHTPWGALPLDLEKSGQLDLR